jgi:NADPH:quinone reductase-like Zn-dependent oxidoreductase
MRAITVSEYGASPAVTELPRPGPGPGQVLIAVQAAGLNPMDMEIVNGGWKDQMPATFPMVLGADLAGIVEEDGPGVAGLDPSDLVFGQLLGSLMGTTST